MNAPRLLDAIGARAVGGWLAELRRELRASTHAATHARFDPVRVEAEFYDAIYGQRSGTVENIAAIEVQAAGGRDAVSRRGDRAGDDGDGEGRPERSGPAASAEAPGGAADAG